MMRYSDSQILHRSDSVNGIYVTNKEIFDTPLLFDQKVHQLLTQICNKAYVSPLFYARGQLRVGLSSTDLAYGAAQCSTRDLNKISCKIKEKVDMLLWDLFCKI